MLERVARTCSNARWKIRLLLANDGEIDTDAVHLSAPDRGTLPVALATEPVNSSQKFLFHKTTNRLIYTRALGKRPDCYDVILWNERGEITESTIANVVISIDGQLYTPPLESGLLAGTFREELLAVGTIRERVILREELRMAASLFLVNSVHKWIPVILTA